MVATAARRVGMTDPGNGNGTTRYRLDSLERNHAEFRQETRQALEDVKREIRSHNLSVLARDVSEIQKDVEGMRRTQTWILRMLVGLAGSIIVGAVLYAIAQGSGAAT